MLELLTDPHAWVSFLTLSALEIVLGIDNVVFISLIISRLPPEQRTNGRRIGLLLALLFRVLMLLGLTWIIGLTTPVLSAFGQDFSWRDVILIAGGLFLLAKSTHEIHRGIEGEHEEKTVGASDAYALVIAQIALVDIIFSVDSIITAIGMADHVEVMIAAVMVSIAVMYVASGPTAAFIEKHPTTKMLALAFLLLIGAALIADGFQFHIPRGYVYFAMAFAASIEIINVLAKKKRRKTDSPSITQPAAQQQNPAASEPDKTRAH